MPRWQKTRRSDPGAATLSVERRQGRSDFLLSDCTMLPAAYLRVSHEAVMEAADGSVLKDQDLDFIQQRITFAADEEATTYEWKIGERTSLTRDAKPPADGWRSWQDLVSHSSAK